MPEVRPYLDMLNVTFTAAPKNLKRFFPPARRNGFPRPTSFPEADIYTSPTSLPRAYIVHKAVFEPDEKLVHDKIRKIQGGFDVVAVIQHEPVAAIRQQLAGTPLKDRSRAVIKVYSPNEVVVEADMENAGFLVLSDTYHPDWEARVNGEPSKIYFTNYLVRSVFLPPGQHTVRFRYEPFLFYAGGWVSLASLLLLAGLLLKKDTSR